MAIININKRYQWIEKWEIEPTKIKAFPDGKLWAGPVADDIDPKGKKVGERWTPEVQLMYGIVAIREEDQKLAHQVNTRLDLKVRVPRNKHIQENMTVKIEEDYYEIKRKDYGKDALYLFLQKRTSADPTLREVGRE